MNPLLFRHRETWSAVCHDDFRLRSSKPWAGAQRLMVQLRIDVAPIRFPRRQVFPVSTHQPIRAAVRFLETIRDALENEKRTGRYRVPADFPRKSLPSTAIQAVMFYRWKDRTADRTLPIRRNALASPNRNEPQGIRIGHP